MDKETPTIILEAGRAERHYWSDLWKYRELFAILAWRDVAVRYKQTVIGVLWAVVRPFITMVIFTIIFGKVAKLPTQGDSPYPLMVFAGMLPWFLFSSILSDSSNSLVGNSHLVGKVYFPRIIIPASYIVVGLVDFVVSLGMFFLLMIWFGYGPSWRILLLPGFVVVCVLSSAGPALWLTSLNVKFRDVRFLVPFISQFGLYISPVGFTSSAIPANWRIWYYLNPMAGVIDGFRWCLLKGGADIWMPGVVLSIVIVVVTLWTAIVYFRRTERTFADVI